MPTNWEDDIRRLAELGVTVETDDEGEIRRAKFVGTRYDDSVVSRLARLKGIPFIDVRDANISTEGVKRLRDSLPDAVIEY